MSLVPKISRLTKLPQLLKKKKEARERSEKDKKDSEKEQPAFNIEDEISISPDTISEYKIEKPARESRKAKSQNKGVGNNLDMKV